jgi:membrane fusion protein, multidrug efflux system
MAKIQIQKPRMLAGVVLSVALAVISGGFYYAAQALAAHADQGQVVQPIPDVEVVTLEPKHLRMWTAFSGRLEAVDQVEVRPRVGGAIQAVLFKEGTIVKAGDPLYVIDPRPYEAAVDSAEATLASAKSQAQLAKTELDRAADLVKKKNISRSTYDARLNDYRVALASIDAANAALKKANLDLEYAHISAPFSGRISRAEITVGNVIEAGQNAPVLTTIVSNDKIYAEFDVDEQTYVKTIRRSSADEPMPVELRLSEDDEVVYNGKIHSFDNRLDTRSGTIRARAIFENKDGVLVPGMYASVRVGSPEAIDTLLISERAIGTDQDKKFVYIVNSEGKIAYREVTLGGRAEGKRIVLSGLRAGAKLVVNNLQRVQPDMAVKAIDLARKQGATRHAEKLALTGK